MWHLTFTKMQARCWIHLAKWRSPVGYTFFIKMFVPEKSTKTHMFGVALDKEEFVSTFFPVRSFQNLFAGGKLSPYHVQKNYLENY